MESIDCRESSNIAAIRYHLDAGLLYVDFKNAAGVTVSTYAFDGSLVDGTATVPGFPLREWEALKAAPSKGKHFAENIRKRYRGRKL